MCGIAGLYLQGNDRVSEVLLKKMTASLKHRGPDDESIHIDQHLGFGHRRLSILDPAHGKQPFFNEKASVCCINNGEIYNFKELRQNLMQKGRVFHTNCDTEILPSLYQEYGIGFLEKLNGMFALALYDREAEKLFLARDRMGIKPVFYGMHGGIFRFGSEIKAILQDSAFPRIVNLEALHDFLTFSYFLPPDTFFKDISELEAGTYAEIDRDGISIHRWWDGRRAPEAAAVNNTDPIRQYQQILETSIGEHLISDVPVGSLLSSGVDSSLVTAVASDKYGSELKAFTVQFPEAAYDESGAAAELAHRKGIPHIIIPMGLKEGSPELIETILMLFDQPFGDTSAIPSYLLFQQVARHLKVVLSGDGGDELFAGYRNYQYLAILKQYETIPTQLRHMLAAGLAAISRPLSRKLAKLGRLAGVSAIKKVIGLKTYLSEEEKYRIYTERTIELLKGYHTESKVEKRLPSTSSDPFTYMTEFNWRFSLNADMLRKVDITSMAHSLEVRVPLLSNEGIRFSQSLPRSLVFRKMRGKYLMKKAAAPYLPESVLSRKKQGFEVPLDTWSNESFIRYLEDKLTGKEARLPALVNRDFLSSTIRRFSDQTDDHIQSRYQNYQRVFMFLSIELCLRNWQCVIPNS